MADISKIRLSGVTYNIVDDSAVHSLADYSTTEQMNSAITAATTALAEAIAEEGYQNATQVSDAIDAAISGKADTTAVTQSIQSAVSGKADTTAVTETIETAISGKADTSAVTEALAAKYGAVEYDSNSKRINFYADSTTETVLSYVDATDFIKDGMVDNVEIKTIQSGEPAVSVTVLAITFNSDAGKEEIDIPLTQIFDPNNYYDKTATDAQIAAATSGKVDTSTYNTFTAATNTALDGKQPTLSAGTGIEIDANNTISVTGVPLTVEDEVTSGSSNPVKSSGIYNAITAATATKQDTLVSGTNIKTVGTESILGSGNIQTLKAEVGTGNDSTTLILTYS